MSMKSREIGTINGDLDSAAQLIRLRMRFNNGIEDEFAVWIQDGMIYMAPVSTREAAKARSETPDAIVNTYKLVRHVTLTGRRITLESRDIAEDLAYHLKEITA